MQQYFLIVLFNTAWTLKFKIMFLAAVSQNCGKNQLTLEKATTKMDQNQPITTHMSRFQPISKVPFLESFWQEQNKEPLIEWSLHVTYYIWQ